MQIAKLIIKLKPVYQIKPSTIETNIITWDKSNKIYVIPNKYKSYLMTRQCFNQFLNGFN